MKPSSEPSSSSSNKVLACDECPYIFTEAEIAAEDKSAWGHPCHGVNDLPGTVCESFRKPLDLTDAVLITSGLDVTANRMEIDTRVIRRGTEQ
jgi:hypothetical protein